MLYALVFGAVADGARLSLARDALGSPTLRGEIFLGWADGFGRVAAARVRPVSRGDQETAPQIRALKEAGCKKVFEETASGGRWDRPAVSEALQAREGFRGLWPANT